MSAFSSVLDFAAIARDSKLYTFSDVLPSLFRFFEIHDLSSVSTASATFCYLTETAWQNVFGGHWSGLFSLKHDISESWRRCCSIRALARRTDLIVNGGQWRICGIVEDRKGRVTTQATCEFVSDSYAMRGHARHFREVAAVPLSGSWLGNLCANIAPKGEKKLWALSWKEKLDGYPGAYVYCAEIHEELGVVVLRGEFSWFGKNRGRFHFVMEKCVQM
eukprot:TRINITY_DN27155_c0_g1_i1.p1 TRINITY_DN27155_c0_g1~~TRINITY_DN27155_c0_g1_i1.p1  ORF type:complete len:255 (-),score=21.89 TRINITY_DN27155_c0_g1_i1:29-685(-)